MNKISRWKAAYRLLKYGIYAPKVRPENIYPEYYASRLGLSNSKTLDLGCGSTPRNPFEAENFYGIDLFEQSEQNIKVADLTIHPIPFADNTFDYITAYDFIEHIPRVLYSPSRSFPFINVFSFFFL
jgi:2-polyprenyl-3-methyl-5-hydroxy-6-metoxy-1,4-benzoquinol methylase